ncbi:MAG TPA: ABC transporter permease subunit [Lachnospiraceae bacterium]|nr:ABC transporter permease subunit [Lachnospiraceae bacterium]
MTKKVLQNLFIVLVFLFLYIPIFMVIVFSFNTSKINIVWEGFTIQWYGSFFQNRTLMESLWISLLIAVMSTAISTVIGTLGALGLSKFNFKGKDLIDQLLYIPVVIPEVVLGVALLCIYSTLNMDLGIGTITLSHVTFCIPFVVINVRARLAGFDKCLEEAAMDLGANPVLTFFKITLPLLMPGVAAGALLSFSLSLDDVIISFFVTGPGSTTLPLKILSMVKTGVTPEVNALSTIIMFTVMIIISINTGAKVKQLRKDTVR